MLCNYPLCRQMAVYTPVVELPCIRTVGLIMPELSPLIHDPVALRKGGFNRNRLIAQFEAAYKDYQANVSTMVRSDKPTYMIGREVCQSHRDTYNLFNWIRRSEWRAMKEAARHYGWELPEENVIIVKFQPLGWRPSQGSLELARDRMEKS